jgi:hypothetical protein
LGLNLEGKEGDAKSYALQQRETNMTLGSEELQGAIIWMPERIPGRFALLL